MISVVSGRKSGRRLAHLETSLTIMPVPDQRKGGSIFHKSVVTGEDSDSLILNVARQHFGLLPALKRPDLHRIVGLLIYVLLYELVPAR